MAPSSHRACTCQAADGARPTGAACSGSAFFPHSSFFFWSRLRAPPAGIAPPVPIMAITARTPRHGIHPTAVHLTVSPLSHTPLRTDPPRVCAAHQHSGSQVSRAPRSRAGTVGFFSKEARPIWAGVCCGAAAAAAPPPLSKPVFLGRLPSPPALPPRSPRSRSPRSALRRLRGSGEREGRLAGRLSSRLARTSDISLYQLVCPSKEITEHNPILQYANASLVLLL